mmetsp:Transcript_30212/g.44646  ORF Transcript_30212/g.44646 Transcript_30212/m.44646 type:complete len:270 (-) Transcript_30212:83-892(-)
MLALSRTASISGSRRLYSSTRAPLKSSADVRATKTVADAAKPAAEAAGKEAVVGESFAKRNPFAFQATIATGKTMAADLMTQVMAEGKSFDEIDWQRNGIFVIFGFAYLGGFQYWLMITKYRQWFPTMDRFAKLSFADKLKDTAGILDAAKMVVFDIVVHLPVMYFPAYYTVKELVGGSSWNPADWVKDGLTKYSKNMKEDLTAMIQLWGPSDCIQFVLPLHVRLPFRHFVSFFWTAYVSFTRGSIEEEQPTSITTTALEITGTPVEES